MKKVVIRIKGKGEIQMYWGRETRSVTTRASCQESTCYKGDKIIVEAEDIMIDQSW